MPHMITRCPACGTCFRITEAQLNTAKGAVRCGSCLQIFKALDNRVDPPAMAAAQQDAPLRPQAPSSTSESKAQGDQAGLFTASAGQPPSSLTPVRSRAAAAWEDDDDDDLLISDEMPLDDDEEAGKDAFFDGDLSTSFLKLDGWSPAHHTSLFEREPRAQDDEDEEGREEPDESWAISLLEDDSPTEAAAETKSKAKQDDSSAQWNKSPANPAVATPPEQPPPSEPLPELELGPAIDEFDLYFDGEGEKLIRERRHLLSSIQPEPVEFSAYEGRNWRRIMIWGTLSVLGMLSLIAQIGWFQFDSLSRHEPYRSVYSAICPLLGCQIPALAAPELIRTSNLVVRSHPQIGGALVVDTILLNTASFRQPFPELTLTFSNRHGETIASRRFQPAEYLAGELAGYQLMPSNQPIHLTLEILDPGPEAVGYSAYIPH